ncbi:MAG: RNA methyltransferase substrate-binding domain-containing protein, partial [Turicibacter sp.]
MAKKEVKKDKKREVKKDSRRENKKESKYEVIYGKNTVNEVLESKRKVFEVIVADTVAKAERGLMATIEKKQIPCKVLPRQKFEQLAKDKYD